MIETHPILLSDTKNRFTFIRIREFFRSDGLLPVSSSKAVVDAKNASIHAIMHYMNLYPNGDPMPLSVTDFFRYGTFTNKLNHRITKLRVIANDISEEMQGLQEQGFGDLVDAALVQKFVIEQFTFLKRFVLQYEFDEMLAGIVQARINFWKWLIAWIFTILW
jgi:hypothetical protein